MQTLSNPLAEAASHIVKVRSLGPEIVLTMQRGICAGGCLSCLRCTIAANNNEKEDPEKQHFDDH
jgi:hypothetical protein